MASQKNIEILKKEITRLAKNPKFVHNKWLIKHHRNLVEQIACETLEFYKSADPTLVKILIWIHNFGWIMTADRKQKKNWLLTEKELKKFNFDESSIKKIIRYRQLIDRGLELNNAPIEVKIVAASDAASHLVGPFYNIWWIEPGNGAKTIEQLMKENKEKLKHDWKEKVVLIPEIAKAFAIRQKVLLELYGEYPSNFLKNYER